MTATGAARTHRHGGAPKGAEHRTHPCGGHRRDQRHLGIRERVTAVKAVPDPAVFTTLKNLVAVAILVGAGGRGRSAGRGPRGSSRADRSCSAVIGVLGGGVAFLLFFSGLAMASAPTAAFIHKTMFIWVALMAGPFLGERLGPAPDRGPWRAPRGTDPDPAAARHQLGHRRDADRSRDAHLGGRGRAGQAGPRTCPLADRRCRPARDRPRRARRVSCPSPVGSPASRRSTRRGWTWVAVTGVLLAGYVGTWLAALRRAPATRSDVDPRRRRARSRRR